MWSRAELRGVAAACARQGVLLVADEIWADWVLPVAAPGEGADGAPAEGGEGGERFVPCSAVAPAEGCALITLGAPTKTWSLAGLHASYLIIPDAELRRRYLLQAEPAFLAYGSAFATTALLAAYSHGGPWLAAAKAHVARNVAYLVDFVQEHVPGIAPLVRARCCASTGTTATTNAITNRARCPRPRTSSGSTAADSWHAPASPLTLLTFNPNPNPNPNLNPNPNPSPNPNPIPNPDPDPNPNPNPNP